MSFFLSEVMEQPEGGTPALNVMEIRDRRNTNASKQRKLLGDVDVSAAFSPAASPFPRFMVSLGLGLSRSYNNNLIGYFP